MKPTPLLIALGLFIILAGFVYYTDENPSETEDNRQPILRIEASKISSITISRPEHEIVTLERGDEEEWIFGQPDYAIRVDESAASLMASTLAELDADRVVEENISEWEPFGLLGTGTLQVGVTVDGGVNHTVVFGDDTPTGAGVFARLAGDSRLFTVFSYVKNGFEKEIFDLRDKKLLRVENGTVASAVLTTGGKSIGFGKTNANSWQITEPGPLRADNYKVDDLIRATSDAEMIAVLESAENSTGTYSFRRPFASVEIIDGAGSHTLTISKVRGDDEKYYARSSDTAGIFEISSTVASDLDKGVDDFRNNKLFDFGFKSIASLDVRDGETDLKIEKREDVWQLTSQGGRDLDSTKVQALIDKLRNLTAKAYPSDYEASFVRYGLTKPMIETSVTTEEGAIDEVLISVPSNDQAYAARRGQPSTYEVETAAVEEIQEAVTAVLKPAEEELALDEDKE